MSPVKSKAAKKGGKKAHKPATRRLVAKKPSGTPKAETSVVLPPAPPI